MAGADFETDWKGADVTRFPARLKAAATCLREKKWFGRYRISYADGLLVIDCLERLSSPKNMDWIKEELALALELYLKHRQNIPGKKSPEVAALSDTLRLLNLKRGTTGDERLRNINGVYLKLMNFRSNDPLFTSQGKKGMTHANALEKVLWDEFSSRPDDLFHFCDAIRAAINELPNTRAFDEDEECEVSEGRLVTRLHKFRERDKKIVLKKILSVTKAGHRLLCEVCLFDFAERYGERGVGFIECHHTMPVCEMGDGSKTRLSDLALVCPNCHRMIHRGSPWLTITELKEILKPAL